MKFQFRGFVSLWLTVIFLVLGFSGIMLYMAPRGRVANWTGWTICGLSRQDWQAVHLNFALLLLIAVGLHLYMNGSLLWCYIKKQGSIALNLKLEMLLAIVLVLVVLTGAVHRFAPFATVVNWNYQIKNYWEDWAAKAPTPHAEELSIRQFADNLGLAIDDVMKVLNESGIKGNDAETTVGRLAEMNHVTPADIYAVIKRQFHNAEKQGKGQGKGDGQGMHRGGRDRGQRWDN